MKNISKLALLVLILLQISGHSPKYIWPDIVDWDEAHPLPLITEYKFGWPIPSIMVKHIQGCTTPGHLETNFISWGFVYDVVFCLVFLNILERWWPINNEVH